METLTKEREEREQVEREKIEKQREETERELAAIEELYGGEVMLDADFQPGRLEHVLLQDRPGIVHLASHAQFTGDPDTSFVLTHGDRISMERLSSLLRASRYGSEPVELLMLSACQTAAGDERAKIRLLLRSPATDRLIQKAYEHDIACFF